MQLSLFKKTKDIIRHYGTGYYRATLLFPRRIKEATWIVYTFVRLPDEIVDTVVPGSDPEAALETWIQGWRAYLAGGAPAEEIFPAFKKVCDDYQIPYEYAQIFLDAMKQDLTVARYATYQDLEQYMYGSAVMVGYMMSHIIGYRDGALPHAKALADAMQLTNFLRDIREDYELRNRIYIPQEDMDRFGVTESHIRDHIVDDAWRALMRFEIERARTLYRSGNEGVVLLDPQGRKAVSVASRMYEGILDRIEKQAYDVFVSRAQLSPYQKTWVIIKTFLWNKNQ